MAAPAKIYLGKYPNGGLSDEWGTDGYSIEECCGDVVEYVRADLCRKPTLAEAVATVIKSRWQAPPSKL